MDNKNIIKLGLILLIICAVSTALLAGVNMLTLPVIEENTKIAENEAMKQVLPDALKFEEIKTGIYKGVNENDLIGYAVTLSVDGYGGKIDMTVGINRDMTVSGIKILSMSETPGLGAKAQDNKFLNQFKNTNEALKLKKSNAKENEINAITGATITSTAVVNGVREALLLVKENGGVK